MMPVNISSQRCQENTAPCGCLRGDIKGCYDHISHDWLIKHIPMDKSVLKQFLKAGFVFKMSCFQ